jgi:hypothetical protein
LPDGRLDARKRELIFGWALREEIDGLILCGEPSIRGPLVERFGGYWPGEDLWSEEFIAGSLLEELSNRLRTAGYRSLTTGFFRPQFFYRYGFTVERRYAGLVKSLEDPGTQEKNNL